MILMPYHRTSSIKQFGRNIRRTGRKNMGRVRYATRNIIFGFLGSGATTLLNFILRQVFITHLGDTLLGVQDLYSEILTMLSLAELGVGTALNYSLYGPVARGEREKIKSYMQLYKKAYRTIAIVIAVIGLALVPFLPWIVKNADYLTLRQLRVYYLLFLFNTVTTYFVAYKYSLANAEQKNYIQTNADAISKAVSVVLQLLGLLVLPVIPVDSGRRIPRTEDFYQLLSEPQISAFAGKKCGTADKRRNRSGGGQDKGADAAPDRGYGASADGCDHYFVLSGCRLGRSDRNLQDDRQFRFGLCKPDFQLRHFQLWKSDRDGEQGKAVSAVSGVSFFCNLGIRIFGCRIFPAPVSSRGAVCRSGSRVGNFDYRLVSDGLFLQGGARRAFKFQDGGWCF